MTAADSLQLHPCSPPRWAKGAHLQTILGAFLPFEPLKGNGQVVWITLPDGDMLNAEIHKPPKEAAEKWVVYLFHGLSGDISADYMQCTANLALKMGYPVVLVNHRGCGAGITSAKLPYHSGRGEDASEVIRWGNERFPGYKSLAVGFSLGGNVVLNMVSGNRGTEKPDAAISVNAPIDLLATSEALIKGPNRIYDLRFVSRLTKEINQRARLTSTHRLTIPRWATLAHFDDVYLAPRSGFTDRLDYYKQCSTFPHLKKIDVPTFILTSADDPFVPVIAYRQAKVSDSVQLHIEETGGHLGYLTKTSSEVPTRRWIDYAMKKIIGHLTR